MYDFGHDCDAKFWKMIMNKFILFAFHGAWSQKRVFHLSSRLKWMINILLKKIIIMIMFINTCMTCVYVCV